MMAWWLSKSQREQQLLGFLGVVTALCVLYLGVWTPIAEQREQAATQVQRQQQLINWMQRQSDKLLAQQGAGGQREILTPEALSNTVSKTARERQITLTRIQPSGKGVQVWINAVPFNSLVGWLDGLERKYQITISQLDVSAEKKPGEVRVQRLLIEVG